MFCKVAAADVLMSSPEPLLFRSNNLGKKINCRIIVPSVQRMNHTDDRRTINHRSNARITPTTDARSINDPFIKQDGPWHHGYHYYFVIRNTLDYGEHRKDFWAVSDTNNG